MISTGAGGMLEAVIAKEVVVKPGGVVFHEKLNIPAYP
jgi:hypothetical protein